MLYDQQTDTIIYQVSNPTLVMAAFPDARPLINDYVGIPASLDNLQKLQASNIETIAPLDKDYDWPRAAGIEPFRAQKVMANFLALHPRCFNLSDMRTGKTLSALWAADYVMRQYEARGETVSTLIIAPLRTLRRTWANAIFQNFIGKRRCVVVHGDAAKRERLLAEPADYYIINHDGLGVGASVNRKVELRGLAAALRDRTDIKIVVVDEASAYRDPGTRRHRVARAIIQNRDYLWMMTGTPTPQGPVDAYGMAKLVNNAYGETLTSYRDRCMVKITQFKWVPRAGAQEHAAKLLTPAVRFAQDDVFDAPDCVYIQEDAEMSHDQAAAYKAMKKDMQIAKANGEKITAINEGVLRWKLIQIACGAVYDGKQAVHLIDSKPRIEVLKDIIREAPRKVIVFAPLTSVLHLLQQEIAKEFTCMLVNGEVPNKEADARIMQFQEGKDPKVLIAHPGPIARGLDLTAAATIVWFAPTDKTEDYIQANQRINGPRQTHKRAIIQIAASSIEREIYKRLDNNESLQGVMLKMVEEDK